jgi:hypothetical protein
MIDKYDVKVKITLRKWWHEAPEKSLDVETPIDKETLLEDKIANSSNTWCKRIPMSDLLIA